MSCVSESSESLTRLNTLRMPSTSWASELKRSSLKRAKELYYHLAVKLLFSSEAQDVQGILSVVECVTENVVFHLLREAEDVKGLLANCMSLHMVFLFRSKTEDLECILSVRNSQTSPYLKTPFFLKTQHR